MVLLLILGLVLAGAAACAAPAETTMQAAVRRTGEWARGAFLGEPQSQRPGRLAVVFDTNPGTAKRNLAAWGGPLRLGDRTYRRGIGVNSRCVLRVTLDQPAANLTADIGLDRNVDDSTPASVRFRVRTAGTEVFATPVMRPRDGCRAIDVPLGGARDIELEVDDAGDGIGWDQGDWADARIRLQDGSVLWLDDLAACADTDTGLPFSFVYGGRASRDLLPHWRRAVSEEPAGTDATRLVVTYTDPETRLEVKAVALLYADVPGVDWTVHFTNRGAQDTPVLEGIQALDWSAAPGLGSVATLHRLYGSAVGVHDWSPIEERLARGTTVRFGSEEGRTSLRCGPFWTLDWGREGVVTALGWSGHWRAEAVCGADGDVRMGAGMVRTHLRLRPGESIRSPRVLQVHWTGADLEDAHNLFRRTMLARIWPRVDGAPIAPPLAHLSTSFYEMNTSTEANTLAHLDAVRGLGFEVFWLDAYWTRDGFPDGMGHYGLPLSRAEAPDRFPGGIRPVSDAAHAAGLKFLLWFEPERVARGTFIAREHPQMVISPAGDGSGLLNLGLPAAREHVTRYLEEAITAYRLDWLRIDYNINPLPFWAHMDAQDPDRAGMAEIRYVEGLYRLWDDLRARHPGLAIDNCASGGTRIDLETCARSVPLWRTDDTIGPLMERDYEGAALRNQVMSHGLNRYVPFSVSGQMGTTPYLWRSGFNGGIAFAQDARPADFARVEAARACAEAARIRRYWFGDFYALSPPSVSASDWCVFQYDLPASGEGVVLAFRRHASPYASFCAELKGIDSAARYSVRRSVGFRPGRAVRMTGASLRALTVRIADRPGSVLIEYRRLGP